MMAMSLLALSALMDVMAPVGIAATPAVPPSAPPAMSEAAMAASSDGGLPAAERGGGSETTSDVGTASASAVAAAGSTPPPSSAALQGDSAAADFFASQVGMWPRGQDVVGGILASVSLLGALLADLGGKFLPPLPGGDVAQLT